MGSIREAVGTTLGDLMLVVGLLFCARAIACIQLAA